jgi:hypothetical protein
VTIIIITIIKERGRIKATEFQNESSLYSPYTKREGIRKDERHTERMGEILIAYKIPVGKSEEKRTFD